MRPLFLWFAVLLFPLFLRGQQDSVIYISSSDTLTTYVHPMGELMFSHTLEAGQTLFSLAKTYGLTIQELYAYNPHVTASYKLGVQLSLPIPLRAIIRQVPPKEMLPGLALVYYRVKRGDTVFGLCNRTFQIPFEWLYSLNPGAMVGLSPGQLLHIGWISTQPIPKEWREVAGGPYAQMNHPMKLEYFRRAANRRITEERGAATWPRDLDDNSGFFCLHRTAPLNSLVEVHNPLTRQTMYLKVSGRLPDRVYDRSVTVVVSPLAAKGLGVRDDRFFVRLKHY